MKKKVAYGISGIILVVILLFFLFSTEGKYEGTEVTIYKSASCGCCGNYIPYLKSEGFSVNVVVVEDISSIKRANGVPENSESCHTTIIGDYFIEGHTPMEAIDKLLTEKPDIDGITLPNMPSGSPGMPGQKKGDFIIYGVLDKEIFEFMRI